MATLPTLVKASRDPETAKAALKELKSRAEVVWGLAADRGTQVRAWPTRTCSACRCRIHAEIMAYFEQYLRFLADFGVEPDEDLEASEASVVGRAVGYAGPRPPGVAVHHRDPDRACGCWTRRRPRSRPG